MDSQDTTSDRTITTEVANTSEAISENTSTAEAIAIATAAMSVTIKDIDNIDNIDIRKRNT